MRKLFTILIILALASAVYAQDEAENTSDESDGIGLAFSLDYFSDYIWRGTKFFNGGGALVPTISWEPFSTGLTLSVSGELSVDWFFDGFQPKSDKYYLDSEMNIYRKKLKINNLAYATHSLDVGADYSYTIKDAVTVGASLWYWWYYNSRHAREYSKTRVDGTPIRSHVDISFLTATFSLGLDIVPYINPALSVTYDHYTALKKGGDFYAQLSFGHDFELTREVSVNLGISGGYYYSSSIEDTYYYADLTNMIWRSRTPLKKGFSDVTPSVGLTYEKNGLSFNAGFNWVIVPAKSWYKGDDNHRYYAKLGIAYSL